MNLGVMESFEAGRPLISLRVSDLTRSREFYTNGLGFTEAPESNQYIAFYRMQSVCLEFYPASELAAEIGINAEGSGFRRFTLSHNVFSEHEVEVLLRLAVAAGAQLIKPANETNWGRYAGCFSDPDGFFWELATGSFLDPVR